MLHGMGMFSSLYIMEANRKAGRAERGVSRTVAKLDEARRELRIMQEKFDKLVLIDMAIWSLLQEKTGLTDEDLAQRIQDIDLADGVADGKITRTKEAGQKCGHCGRVVSQRHRRCLFCGSESLESGPFGGV